MIARGWIDEGVAVRAAAVKRWIDRELPTREVRRFFLLALIASVVKDLSNVKFGPELYCVPAPARATQRRAVHYCQIKHNGS